MQWLEDGGINLNLAGVLGLGEIKNDISLTKVSG